MPGQCRRPADTALRRRHDPGLRIPSAPQRSRSTRQQLLRPPASTMLACDFFHVDCAVTLCRVCVRRHRGQHPLRACPERDCAPDRAWMAQQARNLLMELGEPPGRFRFLIRDRAGRFTEASDAVLADAGIEVEKIPPRSERLCRKLGANSPGRGHRPEADRRATVPACGPGSVRRAVTTSIIRTGPGICGHRAATTSP